MPLSPVLRPARLAVSPSLNRTVLGHFPNLPTGMAGSEARDWLAVWSIAGRMTERPGVLAALREHGIRLAPLPGLSEVTPELMDAAAAWPPALDRLVGSRDEEATALADDLGVALGALVATLVVAPPDARDARPDWSTAQWRSWGLARRISLGGGVIRGALGAHLASRATAWLEQTRVGVTLRRVHDPTELVLRGAASLLPGSGLALDCGGTSIKRAAVTVVGERRSTAVVLEQPAPRRVPAGEVVAVIADAVADAARPARVRGESASAATPLAVSIAIATYVDESGQPYTGQLGPYAPLGEIDLPRELTTAIADRVGRPVVIRVTHDGATALRGARVDDPAVDAAIVLGTAIGSGLDPRSAG